ncbi:hypothetical protein SOVF_165270, partial [Spinacia oleracea]
MKTAHDLLEVMKKYTNLNLDFAIPLRRRWRLGWLGFPAFFYSSP